MNAIPEALLQKSTIPCPKNTPAMHHEMAQEKLEKINGWQLEEGAKTIYRRYIFKNFKHALAFVNHVGHIAEIEGHHPDITLGWGYAGMRMQTHSIGGLHDNDFMMASKINTLYDVLTVA